MKKNELWYLATPYSKYTVRGKQLVFEHSCRITALMMHQGILIFSPIAHSHPIVTSQHLACDWQTWAIFDEKIISACDGLFVLKLPGWRESVGVQAEITIATRLLKPFIFLCASDVGIDYSIFEKEYEGKIVPDTRQI